MNPSYVTAISALGGALIGGLTSFLTTFFTVAAQTRQAKLAAERTKREMLYGDYMTELADLFAIAAMSTGMDYAKLARAFSLKGRMKLIASPAVLQSAEAALKFIMDMFLAPELKGDDVRKMMEDHTRDPIGDFASRCREEMQLLGLG